MSIYHNAVSDKLVVSVFQDTNVHAVYSKDHQLKWFKVCQETLPQELTNSIFSSTYVTSALSRFTLCPTNVSNANDFFNLNFDNAGALRTLACEDFNIIEETSDTYTDVVGSLINKEEFIDVGLLAMYGSQKAGGDSLLFYPYKQGVTIAAWKKGQFMLVNRYPADNLDEVFYYVMLVVEQLELSTESLYFESICSKGLHESFHAMFKNYLAPLHVCQLDAVLNDATNDAEVKQKLVLAQFFAQCVL